MLLTTQWLVAKHFHREHRKLIRDEDRCWSNGDLTVFHNPHTGWSVGYRQQHNIGLSWVLLATNRTEDQIQVLVDTELDKRKGLKAVEEYNRVTGRNMKVVEEL